MAKRSVNRYRSGNRLLGVYGAPCERVKVKSRARTLFVQRRSPSSIKHSKPFTHRNNHNNVQSLRLINYRQQTSRPIRRTYTLVSLDHLLFIPLDNDKESLPLLDSPFNSNSPIIRFSYHRPDTDRESLSSFLPLTVSAHVPSLRASYCYYSSYPASSFRMFSPHQSPLLPPSIYEFAA
jgi:hypothetical protein